MIEISKCLSSNIEVEQKKDEIKRKEGKENFNFFYAITGNKSHHEKYHSNFIAYLLNPNESHDCGHLFSNIFFQITKCDEFVGIKIEHVIREFSTPSNGQPDIVILFEGEKRLFIENKIRSSENKGQLIDYISHFCKEHGEQATLGYFLTKEGDKPESTGSKNELYKKLKCFSYKDDIMKWLDASISAAISYPIGTAIKQYREIIRNELKMKINLQVMEITKENLYADMSGLLSIIRNRDNVNLLLDEILVESRSIFLSALLTQTKKALKEKIQHINVSDDSSQNDIKFIYKGTIIAIWVNFGINEGDSEYPGLYWSVNIINDDNRREFNCGLTNGFYQGVQIRGYGNTKRDLSNLYEEIIVCSRESKRLQEIVSFAADDITSTIQSKVLLTLDKI